MEQIQLFGIDIDALTMPAAVQRLLGWIAERDGTCRYVVTPNLDHALLFQARADLREAYSGAAMVLADGMPLVWASRWLGKPLPERVAGSDLTPALFSAADRRQPIAVYLLGGATGVPERAAARIHARYQHVRVVGTASPEPGFERDGPFNDGLVAEIVAARPDVLIVGLGAPKQELWIHRHGRALGVPVALCVGATIDFMAEARQRAPAWMHDKGLEWLYRAGTEPRRLGPRYAKNLIALPRLLAREWLGTRRV